jgi:putative DNA primase/helicase
MMLAYGLNFRQAVERLAEEAGIPLPTGEHDFALDAYNHLPNVTAIRGAHAVVAEPEGNDASRIAIAIRIWQESVDPRQTLGAQYLARRGLDIAEQIANRTLRFHPALYYNRSTVPGLVALFRDVLTDEQCGIHRTFLQPDGSKIERRMLGRMRGAAIKLDADAEVTMGLTVGEGVETCLAARALGFRPTWALGSTEGIKTFQVLSGVDALTILGETDDGGRSLKAVRTCTQAWTDQGREVLTVYPKMTGDMNTVLQEVVQ